MLNQLLLAKLFCYMTQKLALNLINRNSISKRGRTIKNVLKLHTIKRTVHNRITLMPSAWVKYLRRPAASAQKESQFPRVLMAFLLSFTHCDYPLQLLQPIQGLLR